METWDLLLHTVVTGGMIYFLFKFYEVYQKYQQLLKLTKSEEESKIVFFNYYKNRNLHKNQMKQRMYNYTYKLNSVMILFS